MKKLLNNGKTFKLINFFLATSRFQLRNFRCTVTSMKIHNCTDWIASHYIKYYQCPLSAVPINKGTSNLLRLMMNLLGPNDCHCAKDTVQQIPSLLASHNSLVEHDVTH